MSIRRLSVLLLLMLLLDDDEPALLHARYDRLAKVYFHFDTI